MENKLKVIITGATGMVGEGVMHECLNNNEIDEVVIINRKPGGYNHPKLKEIIHTNFYDLSPIQSQLVGYNACFFCLGITSLGISADKYYNITYTLTMRVAETLAKLNPEMTFCYISGAGTDGTEQGRIRWARVKGKTENDLAKLPFKQVFSFRPGFIKPIKRLKHTHAFYKYVLWIFPIGRLLTPSGFCTMQELARSMIRVVQFGYSKKVLDGKDIIATAN